MKRRINKTGSETGTALVEFAITASFFFMMIVGIVSAGHLFFTHSALVESTRRGARYAATLAKPSTESCTNSSTTVDPVKNMVLYGTTTAGSSTLVTNLQASNITVCYSNDYGVGQGTVSVKIEGYSYTFAVGAFSINMPAYQTTVVGESAGTIPGVTCQLFDKYVYELIEQSLG
ncbi:MAG TPA: TadE/TadG family type IV pilus assembly protein [Pyrinomonadaceae bacterium]|nr:TadE/TadG family type IV pilus assembly protein [Pyrinomonadaceae bacterium]